MSSIESLNYLRKYKFVIEPNYMCFPQTSGSLGAVVEKADLALMTNGAGRIKRQRNSEHWWENRNQMYCSVWVVSTKEFLGERQYQDRHRAKLRYKTSDHFWTFTQKTCFLPLLIINPTILLPEIYLTNISTYMRIIFIATLSVLAKDWKQHAFPSIEIWQMKYSAMK